MRKFVMKKLIGISLFLLTSCMSTEVLMEMNPKDVDTIYKKMYLPQKDTISIKDTTRIPIRFNPIVEDWKE